MKKYIYRSVIANKIIIVKEILYTRPLFFFKCRSCLESAMALIRPSTSIFNMDCYRLKCQIL